METLCWYYEMYNFHHLSWNIFEDLQNLWAYLKLHTCHLFKDFLKLSKEIFETGFCWCSIIVQTILRNIWNWVLLMLNHCSVIIFNYLIQKMASMELGLCEIWGNTISFIKRKFNETISELYQKTQKIIKQQYGSEYNFDTWMAFASINIEKWSSEKPSFKFYFDIPSTWSRLSVHYQCCLWWKDCDLLI